MNVLSPISERKINKNDCVKPDPNSEANDLPSSVTEVWDVSFVLLLKFSVLFKDNVMLVTVVKFYESSTSDLMDLEVLLF